MRVTCDTFSHPASFCGVRYTEGTKIRVSHPVPTCCTDEYPVPDVYPFNISNAD